MGRDDQRRETPLPVFTVRDGDLFADLDAATRATFDAQVRAATYAVGHTFFAPEDQGDRIFLLRSGRVRLYRLSPEGRALTVAVLEPQAVFGEMALTEGWHHDSFAEAMTDVQVGVVRRDILRALLDRHPAVALRVMAVMSSRIRAVERKLADIAFKSVAQRLATVLLSLGDPRDSVPAADRRVVRYTHQQLAEMIGSYRETVTKVLGEFREAGLIRVEDDAIQLSDVARLHALAG